MAPFRNHLKLKLSLSSTNHKSAVIIFSEEQLQLLRLYIHLPELYIDEASGPKRAGNDLQGTERSITAMINPYTIAVLNAERLKDLDREAAGLRYSRLARPARRRIYRAALARLGSLLIATGVFLKQKADLKRI
jgi:hypothetical protein